MHGWLTKYSSGSTAIQAEKKTAIRLGLKSKFVPAYFFLHIDFLSLVSLSAEFLTTYQKPALLE